VVATRAVVEEDGVRVVAVFAGRDRDDVVESVSLLGASAVFGDPGRRDARPGVLDEEVVADQAPSAILEEPVDELLEAEHASERWRVEAVELVADELPSRGRLATAEDIFEAVVRERGQRLEPETCVGVITHRDDNSRPDGAASSDPPERSPGPRVDEERACTCSDFLLLPRRVIFMAPIDIDAFLDFIGDRPDAAVIEALRPVPRGDLARLLRAVSSALASAPIPIERGSGRALAARREQLRRAHALLEAQKGDPTRLIGVARERWVEGGRHLEYLRLMVAFGRRAAALDLAFALLERELSAELVEVDRFLADTLEIPAGYDAAIATYLRAPSAEAFDALLRFSPPDLAAHRLRHTVRRLLLAGADPSTLLAVAGHRALTEEMHARIDDGEIPASALARLPEHHPESAPEWLGLAARSAHARGDQLGTIRLLRVALRHEDRDRARQHLEFVREIAGPELLAMLDRAGLR
jgi:hypothetical protein